jgi:hypothetical protein
MIHPIAPADGITLISHFGHRPLIRHPNAKLPVASPVQAGDTMLYKHIFENILKFQTLLFIIFP